MLEAGGEVGGVRWDGGGVGWGGWDANDLVRASVYVHTCTYVVLFKS